MSLAQPNPERQGLHSKCEVSEVLFRLSRWEELVHAKEV